MDFLIISGIGLMIIILIIYSIILTAHEADVQSEYIYKTDKKVKEKMHDKH